MDWKNQLPMIQNKVKSQLHSRKMDDLESVRKLIEEFDIDRNGVLDKVEFGKLLSKAGIYLTTQELTCIYNVYDLNKDGYISYNEFVGMIRTDMSEKRLSVVKHAFQFLDAHRERKLRIQDLLKAYHAEDHPRVRTREKTPEQAMNEFKNAIIKKSSDGAHITEADFLDYYADVNATLPLEKEEYFVDLVLKTWGITTSFNYVSPERVAELEAILYEKIRQKTLTKEDEGKTVRKAFKYFDLDDSGLIDLDKFTKALDKFGCVFNKYEILALFKKYDSDNSGRLCYDEFCNMFALIGSGNNANVNPVFELARQYPKPVIDQARNDCKRKGLYGIRELSKALRKMDKLSRGGITRNDFLWALKETGTTLSKHDLDKIYKYFDKKSDDFVRYPEFIEILRGDLPQRRADLIRSVWQRLGPDGNDAISFGTLQKSYDPFGQDQVKIGKVKPDHAFKEFIAQWEVRKDGLINYADFFDFYWDVSSGIEDDQAFENLIRNSWNFPVQQNLGNTQASLSPEQKTVKNLSVRFADNVNIHH